MKKSKQKKSYAVRHPLVKQAKLLVALLACVAIMGGVYYGLNDENDTIVQAPKVTAPQPTILKDQTPGEEKKNIEYCNGQLLDIYEPLNLKYERSPVVVYIHGGGWVLNDKSSEPDQLALLDELRNTGYTIVSLNYSKVPAAHYPRPVEDSLCAIRFLRAHADIVFFKN